MKVGGESSSAVSCWSSAKLFTALHVWTIRSVLTVAFTSMWWVFLMKSPIK